MYKKIMIATDGSELGDKAVDTGIQLASSLNARVVITRVVPRYPTAYFEGAVVLQPQDIARIESQWHDEAEKSLARACERAASHALKVSSVLYKSDFVAESLIATAKKSRCDLIVMASHGHKALKRLLLGSETLNVLTHSHIPVLVLR
ncbi:universal stress protein [Variovorax sp. PCZ-1]|uniref:universal stress protein n=1 Tax=Variovorax sp. PCZ-1 TaxID=2835533 RepID=UPI001BCB71F2|nr:universal stress protein [Variovorax sp. PCZ-1]MBS7807721.1 universal stress protein [Variovorax sp. PCZ-1]